MNGAFKKAGSTTPKEVAFTQSHISVLEVHQSTLIKENDRLEKALNEKKASLDATLLETARQIDEAQFRANEILQDAENKRRLAEKTLLEVSAKSGVLDQKLKEADAALQANQDTQKNLLRRLEITRDTESDADAKMLRAEMVISEAQKASQQASEQTAKNAAERSMIESQRQQFSDEMHAAAQTIERLTTAKQEYEEVRSKMNEERKALVAISEKAQEDILFSKSERESLARERQKLDVFQSDLDKESIRLKNLNSKIVEQKTFIDLEERRVRRLMELKGLRDEVTGLEASDAGRKPE